MPFADIALNFAISVVAGIVGILIVLWIERQKRPKLKLRIANNQVMTADIDRRPDATWLHVAVINVPIAKWLKWAYNRETAFDCRAWIGFYRADGTRLQQTEMEGRWAGSPEPQYFPTLLPDGRQALYPIVNPFTMNISESQKETLGIVVRLRSEDTGYGFWNGSYRFQLPSNKWRDPDWKLDKGIFIAKVRVSTGGQEFSEGFRIINDVPYNDFRLESLTDTKIRRKLGLK